jgi:Spy/CpxP family protein refolding chaperone
LRQFPTEKFVLLPNSLKASAASTLVSSLALPNGGMGEGSPKMTKHGNGTWADELCVMRQHKKMCD